VTETPVWTLCHRLYQIKNQQNVLNIVR
jgi:hypothetical protein